MLTTEGPLAWPLLPPDPPAGADPTQWDSAQAAAVEWLWSASGRQFGTRSTTYRPATMALCAGYFDAVPYLQSIYGPLWGQGWPFAGDPRETGRTLRQVVELPGPAVEVDAVQLVDGAGVLTTLTPADYRLDGNYLVRVDGSTWPSTQDTISDDGQPNTWHVVYSRGVIPPVAGQIAAAKLAAEWLKLITGDASCKLPRNTTAVARAGVTITRDPSKIARQSGIELVDRWIETVNPDGLTRPPRIWSPDTARNQPGYAGAAVPYRPLG